MEKYAILLGYFDKQMKLILRLSNEVKLSDVSQYESKYVFALKTQQLYTAIEDLFKQIAKSFENNIDKLGSYHRELLNRMYTDVPGHRPAVLSSASFALLDKVRAFRHFIRHAYDCELDERELKEIQKKLHIQFDLVVDDLNTFREYILELTN